MGRTTFLLLIPIALLASGCASRPHIVVGSKNFTEQVVLGEIVARQIERRLGIEVDRKLDLGGTLLAHEALRGGSIDLYPEYTGTALTAVLKQPIGQGCENGRYCIRGAYGRATSQWGPRSGLSSCSGSTTASRWWRVPETAREQRPEKVPATQPGGQDRGGLALATSSRDGPMD